MSGFFPVVMAAALAAAGGTVPRQDVHPVPASGFLFEKVTVQGHERRFAIYVPREYDRSHAWPLIVFLNGSGECGEDGQRQMTQGLAPAILNDPNSWPFLVVFPQKPDVPSSWLDHDDLVMATLRFARERYRVDPDRIYLTGLSQGGAGSWAIGAKHAELFAAIAPVCGFGDPDEVAKPLAKTPLWAFHGKLDDVVAPEREAVLVEAMKAAGGDPKFTLYPDLNHGCWDRVYRDEELGTWFLENARRRKPRRRRRATGRSKRHGR
jgi:predicted peptidase